MCWSREDGVRCWVEGWRGEERQKEGRKEELFIAVSEYVVHKDCSEGYPKEEGQQRHRNKRWESGGRDRTGHG